MPPEQTFEHITRRCHLKYGLYSSNGFRKEAVLKMLTGDRLSMTLNIDQGLTLTLSSIMSSFGYLFKHIFQLLYFGYEQFLRNPAFFHVKA